MIERTAATNDAIAYVMANLWERGAQELDALEIDPDVALTSIQHWRDSGYPTMAWLVDREPVFVIGLVPKGPALMETWFIATEAFRRHKLAITRELRHKVDDVAVSMGLREVEIHSPCIHPDSGRWFGALGFTLDVSRHSAYSDASTEGTRLYRFVRRYTQ